MGVDETTIKSGEGQVECTVLNLGVNGVLEGRVVDLGSLYAALAEALALERPQAPSVNTYRQVLGASFEIEESERVMREFLPHSLTRVSASLLPYCTKRSTVQVCSPNASYRPKARLAQRY
jgi:hypothetical protein